MSKKNKEPEIKEPNIELVDDDVKANISQKENPKKEIKKTPKKFSKFLKGK